MKKLILLVFVLTASAGFAQEMKMPDDKKKSYVKEDKKKTDEKSAITTSAAKRDESAGTEQKSIGTELVSYCIVKEWSNEEYKKQSLEILTDVTALSKSRDVDPVKIKELSKSTQSIIFKTAIEAINTLALQGYRITSSHSYVSGSDVVKEYVMIKTDW